MDFHMVQKEVQTLPSCANTMSSIQHMYTFRSIVPFQSLVIVLGFFPDNYQQQWARASMSERRLTVTFGVPMATGLSLVWFDNISIKAGDPLPQWLGERLLHQEHSRLQRPYWIREDYDFWFIHYQIKMRPTLFFWFPPPRLPSALRE